MKTVAVSSIFILAFIALVVTAIKDKKEKVIDLLFEGNKAIYEDLIVSTFKQMDKNGVCA